MSFPINSQVSTQNLNSSSDDPSLARADLLQAVENLNAIVASAGAANGVALLDGSGSISSTQMPSNFETVSNLHFLPQTRIVKIDAVLRLQPVSTDELLAIENITAGDLAFVQDGDSGAPCLAVFAQNQWNVIPFITGAISKTVQSNMSATFTLLCDGTEI
jgi:hypothetical protein